jgi:bifunctional DNA-binding transcriptional regulator/antitoxin component of YhaV-PrlF toxin-antitoxin module
MKRLTAGLSTKSDKIRVLGQAGYARQQIADFLGIRYQHVRNVLVDAEKKGKVGELAEPRATWRSEPSQVDEPGKIRVQTDGSVVIPSTVLAEAGFGIGDRVLSFVKGEGEIHLLSRRTAIRHAQELVRKYVPEGISLVDELIAERRSEAEKEEREATNGQK